MESIPSSPFALFAAVLLTTPLLAAGPVSRSGDPSRVALGFEPVFPRAPAGECGCSSGTPENEPDCGLAGDPPTDTKNGGCNSVPPVFGSISCGETVCGTVGTKSSSGTDYRDTDWYAFEADQPQRVEIELSGEIEMIGFILHDGAGGPPACSPAGSESAQSPACGEASAGLDVQAGTFWAFAAPTVFAGVTCGTSYRLTLVCPIFRHDFEQPGALCFWSDTAPPVLCE